MSSWVDLLLMLIKDLLGLRSALLSRQRNERARIAGYFDAIAKALLEAANDFESGRQPFDAFSQIQVHLANFLDTVGDTLPNRYQVNHLWRELDRAMEYDQDRLTGPLERPLLDKRTVVPPGRVHGQTFWRTHTPQERRKAAKAEAGTLREIAGLFKGFAVELLAKSK